MIRRSSLLVHRTLTRGLLAAGTIALAASCSVAALDLAGKACPCTSGWVCDVEANRCVLEGTLPEREGSVAPDVSPGPDPDARVADAPVPGPARVQVSELVPVWVTPNVVRWQWKVTGDPAAFRAYEFVVGTKREDVEKRMFVNILTSVERPELAAFDARAEKPPVAPAEAIVWTTSDLHAAGKPVFAQVKVSDVDGRESVSNIIGDFTAEGAPLANSLPIFVGAVCNGTGIPPCNAVPAAFQFKSPAAGEPHYQLAVVCPDGGLCTQTAGFNNLNISASGISNAAAFDSAFVQFEVEGTVGSTTFDSEVALTPPASVCPGPCRFTYSGWTQRSGVRSVLQVPLRELRYGTTALSYSLLQAAGPGVALDAFRLSGTWRQGNVLRVYDARIRWRP